MEGLDGISGVITDVAPFAGLVVGLVVGLITSLLVSTLASLGTRSSVTGSHLLRRTRVPFVFFFATLGAWLGYVLTAPSEPPGYYSHVAHGLLIGTIVCAGWLTYAALGLLGEEAILTDISTGRDARRFRTQAQVLRHFLQSLTAILTIVFCLLTFPQARAPMASILASAGLLSVVAGLAAQTTLGNIFAGLQLAFTDALRVGDNVVVPGEEQPGRVEEVTLTYVVVRVWDERRVILPSTEFTTKGFENWSRRSANQLLAFEIQVDWTAPVAEIRAEVQKLLEETDLWDGRTWSVQVSNLAGPFMTLKIVVSGANWARLQDLRAYLRENLVSWIRLNAAWAIPRERFISSLEPKPIPQLTTETIDSSILTAPAFTGPLGGGDIKKEELFKPDPNNPAIAPDVPVSALPKSESTDYLRPPLTARLFSGSPEGDERAALYNGPGIDVLTHRMLRSFQKEREVASIPLQGEFDDSLLEEAKHKLPQS